MTLPDPPAGQELASYVGTRIREAREAAGLTQAALARALEIARPTISYWEVGERTPGLDDLLRLSVELDRTPDYFMPQVPEREPTPTTAIFRAEATRLAGVDLGPEIDRLIKQAGRLPRPPIRFRPSSRRAEDVAQELLTTSRVSKPPIDVQPLAARCGVRVVRRRFSSDALSGFLVTLADGPVIGANARHALVRQRFTIAHELGHLLLGHHADYHLDLDSPVATGDPPGYDWRSERAANTFSANLLMPERFLHTDVRRKPADIQALAARYNVSHEAMAIRLAALDLT